MVAKRRGRKSLKKLLDDAAEAAEARSTTLGPPLLQELDEVIWHEDEIILFSPTIVDLPGKVYRAMSAGLKRRGFQVTKQREVELRNDRLMLVNRYIVEGEGAGEEATIYARLHDLAIVEAI